MACDVVHCLFVSARFWALASWWILYLCEFSFSLFFSFFGTEFNNVCAIFNHEDIEFVILMLFLFMFLAPIRIRYVMQLAVDVVQREFSRNVYFISI